MTFIQTVKYLQHDLYPTYWRRHDHLRVLLQRTRRLLYTFLSLILNLTLWLKDLSLMW